MTSFENIHEIDLFSLIKITSVAPFDEFNETCAKDNLAIVIDKDYIRNSTAESCSVISLNPENTNPFCKIIIEFLYIYFSSFLYYSISNSPF